MTEIKLTLEGQTNPQWLADNLRARAKYMAEEVNAWNTAAALERVADSIEEQVKPTIEEPTGDVVVLDAVACAWLRDDESGEWLNDSPVGARRTWPQLLAEYDDAPKVYRYTPQSDGAGALPTSPSPEVGVATSPPASSPQEPQEFGSVVRASSVRYEEQNWTPIPRTGEHWWHSETGKLEMWRDLVDPEVLRIGVGVDEKACDGWREGFNQGNLDTRQRIYSRLTRLRATLITAPEHTAIDKALAEIEADVEDTVTGRGFPS